MEQQVEIMRKLTENVGRREEMSTGGRSDGDKLKLMKLMDSEDIEALITTFERMMNVYGIQSTRWAHKLAPLLTVKAQQAYAAMDARDYEKVKQAVLWRYDINEETYRQRFRGIKRKEGESYTEVTTRLNELARKWPEGCHTHSQ